MGAGGNGQARVQAAGRRGRRTVIISRQGERSVEIGCRWMKRSPSERTRRPAGCASRVRSAAGAKPVPRVGSKRGQSPTLGEWVRLAAL